MKQRKILLLLSVMVLLLAGCGQNSNTETDGSSQTDTIEISSNEHEIEYFTVTKDNPMENRGLKLEIWGSAVYDKIEGEDFTDTPAEGKKYLVLFLKIQNRTGKDDYFNYNNISAKLDGEDITDTFLVNDPEGYTTIKATLTNEKNTLGYLVWEVPESWEKLEITYTGWTQAYYTEPTIILTPEDLETPDEYKTDYQYI